ncbi:MAG: hypothetical protein QW625_00615 [Candidatus Nanoarchaeia archaeon]
MVKKAFLFLLISIIAAIFISGCVEKGEKSSSACKTDFEGAKCSITNDGIATLSNLNVPANSQLINAKSSLCEITGRLWSCEEIGSSVSECEIVSASQPFKAKCPIRSGAWSVKFTILKPQGCPDPVDPSVLRDCEEIVRIYQQI